METTNLKSTLTTEIIEKCRAKLLHLKTDILNRIKNSQFEMSALDKASGDEIDQTVAQMAENTFVANQERMRTQLMEIEFALSRIQQGSFGVCEETGEAIETERLLAIPYTKLSIEGAEIREALSSRFAR